MSDNYKTISRTRATIEALLDKGWVKTKIIKEIGISFGLYQEIMEYDPVAVCGSRKFQAPTIAKLKDFLEKHEVHHISGKERARAPEEKPAEKKEDPKPTRSMKEVLGQLRNQRIEQELKQHAREGDLLEDLNGICRRFLAKGYRLDVSINKIYQPAET